MSNRIKQELLDLQQYLSKDGSYFAQGQRDFNLIGMNIDGMGIVPLPLTPTIAQQIITHAKLAPYGKDHETLLDTSVRSTWEIEPEKITLSNHNLANHLKYIISDIQDQLDIDELKIEANFYKLLLYEKDSFFLKHKDSEKEKGMFGTLVITLPSSYEGGEFVIEYDGKQEIINHQQKEECLNWVAFYADCSHEILRIKSGYRLALVYNLLAKERKLSPFENSVGLQYALQILQQSEIDKIDQPVALFLKHQYTEANFSLDLLKGSDKTCATILLEACKHLGWYANIGLLEHKIIGTPEYDYYDDDIDAETAEMDEIIDEDEYFLDWCIKPSLGNVNIDELLLVNKTDYEKEEPVEKESEGYMGNYGPDLYFTYRNSVLIIAPPKVLPKLLRNIGFQEQLEWMNCYLNCQPIEISKAEDIYSQLDWEKVHSDKLNFESVFRLWSLNQNLFLNDSFVVQKYNRAILNVKEQIVISFLQTMPFSTITGLFSQGISHDKAAVISKHYELGNTFLEQSKALFNAMNLVDLLLIGYENQKALSTSFERSVLSSLVEIFDKQEFSLEKFTKGNEQKIKRNWLYEIAIPVTENYKIENKLIADLRNTVLVFLKANTELEPQYPKDYVRFFPQKSRMDEYDKLLKEFCEDGESLRYDFKRKEQERKEMEYKIRDYNLDISTQTIKQKSPYTLQLTKNTKSYSRVLEEYKEDLRTIEKLSKR